MAEERVFLNDHNVFVSNARVVIHGTTYATANITSVAKRVTPANKGCAVLLVAAGVLALVSALASFASATAKDGLPMLIGAAMILAIGIAWLRSLKPTFHVFLASAAAERQGMSSQDEALVNRVTTAISDAITHRG
jgi:hypothetical protein